MLKRLSNVLYWLGCIFAVLTAAIGAAHAAYLVDGDIEGSVCSDWIVFSRCHMVGIDAVEGNNGQLFTVTQRFESVDEHTGDLCFIRLHYDGWMAWIWRKAKGPVFFTKLPDGKYEKVEPDYVVFSRSRLRLVARSKPLLGIGWIVYEQTCPSKMTVAR